MKLSTKDKEALAELLIDWEEASEKGQEITPQELCFNALHLLEAATIAIQYLKLLNRNSPPKLPKCLSFDPIHEADNFIQISTILNKRFRVDSLLGHGGHGIVYKAFDLQLKRSVALKTTKHLSMLQEKEKQILLEEAQKIANLNHPGIVQLFDIMEFNNSLFFISEYLEEGDLAGYLRKKNLTFNQKLFILKNVASALDYAHLQGIVHRDLKPSNVLLTQNLHPKICDFGIAFKYGELPSMEPVGTIAYCSPEQIQGQKTVRSTDIWSLGVILFETFTNQLPFQGAHPHEIMQAILYSKIRFPKDYPIPERLKKLIYKCLEKDSKKRPLSGIAITNILEDIEKKINPAFRRRRFLLMGTYLVGCLGLIYYLFQKLDLKRFLFKKTSKKKDILYQVTSDTMAFLNPRLNRLEHYSIGDPLKWHQVSPNSFVGKPNAHNIAFNHPLSPPFTFHFQIMVRSGIRVRLILANWDIHLGNEGFARQISVYGDGKTIQIDQPYLYKLEEELKCKFSINKSKYSLHVNDKLVSEGFVKPQTKPVILALSSGDPFSPGEVVFGNFFLEPN